METIVSSTDISRMPVNKPQLSLFILGRKRENVPFYTRQTSFLAFSTTVTVIKSSEIEIDSLSMVM